jgi:hypothetical protein
MSRPGGTDAAAAIGGGANAPPAATGAAGAAQRGKSPSITIRAGGVGGGANGGAPAPRRLAHPPALSLAHADSGLPNGLAELASVVSVSGSGDLDFAVLFGPDSRRTSVSAA